MEEAEKDPTLSNRKVASKLGVSIKLAHEILGRMVNKGLFHVTKHHARKWDYFLTPSGISEKSRLTMEFLSFSMHFYREARRKSAQVCRDLHEEGIKDVSFLGHEDLAEIVYLGIQEWKLNLNCVYADTDIQEFMNIPILPYEKLVDCKSERIIVCIYDLKSPRSEHFLPKDIPKLDHLVWIF